MSNRRFIRREELEAGTQWERFRFDAPVAAEVPAGPDPFEQGLEQGLQQGYAAGRQEALDRAARQAQADAQRVQALCDALVAQRAPLTAQLARDVVDLALLIARQVVGQTLTTEPERITQVVADALAALPRDTSAIEVICHPDDAQRLAAHLANGSATLTHQTLRLVPDARISVGGCRIAAPCGDVDATLETRWNSVLAALDRSLAPPVVNAMPRPASGPATESVPAPEVTPESPPDSPPRSTSGSAAAAH